MVFQKTCHFFHHNVASFIETIFTSGKTTIWVLDCSICATDRLKGLTGRDKLEAINFWNRGTTLRKEGKI